MKQSESISKLAQALVNAQGELRHAKENAVNPHFKNNYADLSSVIDAIRPAFAKFGLAFVQFETFEAPNTVSVETVLMHQSGEFISEKSGCLAPKSDPQGIGSAITYLRRYSLAALAGITQADDDGNEQSGQKPEQSKQAPAPKQEQPKQEEQKNQKLSQNDYKAGDEVDVSVWSSYKSTAGKASWDKKYPNLIISEYEAGKFKVLKK